VSRITVLGAVNSYTGYGLHTIQAVRDIETLSGAYVSVRALSTSEAFGARIPMDIRRRFVNGPQPEPWELLIHPPNFLPTPGKKTAYFSMWEATRLPPKGRSLLNKATVVFTPSHWNASTFSACGVDVPIEVVPLGINTKAFYYRPPPQRLDGLCVFGAAGRMAHGGVRKGINEVIEAFLAAFPKQDDARLRIKCWPDCPVAKVRDNRISITAAYLSDDEVAEWFSGIHVFVSAARAEGWGLMQHQAMAVGRPIITVDFGGVREFFKPAMGYALPYRMVQATKAYDGCGHWAEPDFDDFVSMMRHVYERREQAQEKGRAAAVAMMGTDWLDANRVLVSKLMKLGAL